MRSELLALVALFLAGCPTPTPTPTPTSTPTSTSTSTSTFRPADPAHAWSFPRDHFARPGYRNEWWYFTGTLASAEGGRFGFQLTFFKVGLLPERPAFASAWASAGMVMAHLAVTDPGAGRHHFSEVLWRESPLLGGFGAAPGPLVAWAKAPAGTPGRWTLELVAPQGAAPGAASEPTTWRLEARDDRQGLALSLALAPRRATVLQGPNGYSRKAAAPGFASEYYSQTRLTAGGRLQVGGAPVEVEGEGWMDREVGSSLLAPGQVGWDWFALRLDDGRDLVLYLLRRADGSVDWSSGALIGPGGAVRALAPGDWTLRALRRWRSPETGADYPVAWRLEVPSADLDLTLSPDLEGAENRSALVHGLYYWEGPVTLSTAGRRIGEGYVELTGYGAGGRLPL